MTTLSIFRSGCCRIIALFVIKGSQSLWFTTSGRNNLCVIIEERMKNGCHWFRNATTADVVSSGEALTIIVNGCKVAINNNAGRDVIYHTISALRELWSVICPECRKFIWLRAGRIWGNLLTDSWQSFGITSRWILSRMPSFCSADEKIRWKLFTSTGMGSCSCRSVWTMESSSGPVMLRKSDLWPDRNSAGWWKGFLLISRKQYSQQKAKIFDLCNMQILKKFSTCETSLQWKISTYVKSQRALSVDRYAQVHNNVYNFTEKLQKPA